MGRGRAKAKQAKVARQLKYNTPEMDLERLQRELSGNSDGGGSHSYEDDYAAEYEGYAEYVDEEYGDWDDPQR
ncbi:MAG TPA: DUF3073 domain-containing protein [Candidatus Corynebacterium gallistercoris]|uniref:DUF3073 domain-containing protein n=1 Tax=Candidatus Corynebacterium gallistercoris TaxID=2838530 RepID=A0A9D1RWQ0_9CORY|nr:DUF3073 domain-containing protein [Candidatus Corynebacterium gallistercoris]